MLLVPIWCPKGLVHWPQAVPHRICGLQSMGMVHGEHTSTEPSAAAKLDLLKTSTDWVQGCGFPGLLRVRELISVLHGVLAGPAVFCGSGFRGRLANAEIEGSYRQTTHQSYVNLDCIVYRCGLSLLSGATGMCTPLWGDSGLVQQEGSKELGRKERRAAADTGPATGEPCCWTAVQAESSLPLCCQPCCCMLAQAPGCCSEHMLHCRPVAFPPAPSAAARS